MSLSSIASSVPFHFDTVVRDEGVQVIRFSGSFTLNSYQEPIYSGFAEKKADKMLFANLRAEDRQYLPEGNRNDQLLIGFLPTKTPTFVGELIGDKVQEHVYEVVQVTRLPFGESKAPYQRVLIRRIDNPFPGSSLFIV